jgi:hypothetical protein
LKSAIAAKSDQDLPIEFDENKTPGGSMISIRQALNCPVGYLINQALPS